MASTFDTNSLKEDEASVILIHYKMICNLLNWDYMQYEYGHS